MPEEFKKFIRTGGKGPVTTKQVFSDSFCSRDNYCWLTTLHTVWLPSNLVC